MGRGALWPIVHGVAKSWTWVSFTFFQIRKLSSKDLQHLFKKIPEYQSPSGWSQGMAAPLVGHGTALLSLRCPYHRLSVTMNYDLYCAVTHEQLLSLICWPVWLLYESEDNCLQELTRNQSWWGPCLAILWLRLCAFTAGGTGLIPGQGRKIPHATWPNK